MPTPLSLQLAERQITLDSLVQATKLTKGRASDLMAGAAPTIDEVRSIANAFGFNVRFLITGAPASKQVEGNLRQNFGVRDDLRSEEVNEIILQAEEISTILPAAQGPKFRISLGSARGVEDAESLAHFCRTVILELESDEPTQDLEQIIGLRTGIITIVKNIRSVEGSALSVMGHDFIFVARRGGSRMRFTLAHELCHCLVDLKDDSGWFDEDVVSLKGDAINVERFANAFAGALLMPASATAAALKVFRKRNNATSDSISDLEVAFLARFFDVNFQVAARRCEELRLIPHGGSNALYRSVISRYKSPEELADRIGVPRRPSYSWSFGTEKVIAAAREQVISGSISVGRLS